MVSIELIMEAAIKTRLLFLLHILNGQRELAEEDYECLIMNLLQYLCIPQNLSVHEVQGLLGTNLADLKSYENQTLVQNWIRMQSQSQLDTLGLGLQGGRADSTPSTSSTNFSSATTSSVTATTTGECKKLLAKLWLNHSSSLNLSTNVNIRPSLYNHYVVCSTVWTILLGAS